MSLLLSSLMLALALSQDAAPFVKSSTSVAPASLARAEALYDAAAYEEALSMLIAIETPDNVAEVQQYRALCLLALGRSDDAVRAVEQIVQRKPLFMMDVADVSPRLVLMFRDVRQRMLPDVARNLYARAKANYDARRYPLAAEQLQEVVTLLGADDPAASGNGMAELRLLAEGFLKLSLAETGPVRPVTSAGTPVPRDGVYSRTDRAVIAPVEIVRYVPNRVELAGRQTPGLYQGLVEVVIDETGVVRSAEILRSVTPAYDISLMAAVREWRFQPATLNGAPVPYRKSFEIIVHSR